jgi:N4-gp56 family major capsid protein
MPTRLTMGMKREVIEAQVTEFGFYMTFTKRSLEMDTEKGLLTRYSRGVGVAYGDTREAQIRASLLNAGEVNATYGGAATQNDQVDDTCVLTFKALRLMDKSLKDAHCPKDTELIKGSRNIDTKTVTKARYVYVGSALLPTLEDMTHGGRDLWVGVEMYAAAGTIADGEIGKIGQFRFIEDEEFPAYEGEGAVATNADFYQTTVGGNSRYDVFPLLFVGSGSFLTVGFQGDSARVNTIMPKADAHNDVYGKKGAVAISWYYGFMTLRPEWIRMHKVAAVMA